MAAKEKKEDGGVVELIKTVVWALIIAGIFRTLFFQPFWIPSASMKDTLLIGDFLFVNKMAYGYSAVSCPFSMCPIKGRILARMPKRGDVVVFRHPVKNEDYIKRLIGLPGDKIQMKQGVLYINGAPAPQQPDGKFVEKYAPQGPLGNYPRCKNNPPPGGDCVKDRLTETLPNGVRHDILNISMVQADNTPVYTVPDGYFFFMGDNRDNSSDSRFAQPDGVGMVPFANLIGRADRIMFSSAGRRMLYFWTWRADRFFKRIE